MPERSQMAAARSIGLDPSGLRLEEAHDSGSTGGYQVSTGPDVTGITLQAAKSTNNRKRAVGRCQE